MLLFWVVIAVLTCAATSLVAWPLLANARRPAATAEISDEARRLAVYRDRRREIEAERDAGRLTAEEAARSLDELATEAAAQFGSARPDKTAASAPASAGSRWPLIAAVAAVLTVPTVGLALYGVIGAPELVAGVPAAAAGGDAQLDRAIADLQSRVRKNPSDAQAWSNLGEASRIKGDLQGSVAAYKKALALAPENARALADYAEALAIAAGGRFTDEAAQLLDKAIAADPNEVKAIVLMGVAQYHQGNAQRALMFMRKAVAAVGQDSPDGQQIAQVIARIEAETGAAASKTSPAAKGSAKPATAKTGASVSGRVTIDESLRTSVPAGAVLFVSARLPQGPRIPLAAVRLAAGQFPQSFELGDAQAMDPARLVSTADKVVIDAHVSASGSPTRQKGDAFGSSAPVKPGARGITVKIDQRVP